LVKHRKGGGFLKHHDRAVFGFGHDLAVTIRQPTLLGYQAVDHPGVVRRSACHPAISKTSSSATGSAAGGVGSVVNATEGAGTGESDRSKRENPLREGVGRRS
jgi:hypothetical protein